MNYALAVQAAQQWASVTAFCHTNICRLCLAVSRALLREKKQKLSTSACPLSFLRYKQETSRYQKSFRGSSCFSHSNKTAHAILINIQKNESLTKSKSSLNIYFLSKNISRVIQTMQISAPHTLVCGIKQWLNFLLQVDKDDTCPCSDVMGACTPWTWSSRLHSLYSDARLKSVVLVMQHLNTKRERWNIRAWVTERLVGLKLGSQMLGHIIFSKWTWDWWEMCLFSSISVTFLIAVHLLQPHPKIYANIMWTFLPCMKQASRLWAIDL